MITISRAQAIKNIRKKIKSHSLIFLNTNQKDLIQRQQSTKMILRFIFRCFITIFVILRLAFLFNPEINHRFNENAIIFFLVIYFIYYFFCSLSLKISNIFWLIIVLVFTNPIFALYISLISLNYIGQLRNKSIFATNTEGFLYMLLQIGTENRLIIFSLILSLIFHLTFVFIQPIYKIEKSRMALESMTVIYGVISILGLVYSKEIAKILFEYLMTTPYFGEDFFQAARSSGFNTISSLSGFTSFFEKTFKLFLLPFTICASLATMIFKFREFFSKNMANEYFQKIALSQDILLNEQITLLKKAIYYGGGTMKNTILGHHHLYKYIPDLLEKSKKNSLVKY
ncbi:hypothetical protein NLX74_09905 [Paenibacillus sp. MZ03-122A]|nr:hypothetical protein [Paenibacillus sp. MZ03-122A]